MAARFGTPAFAVSPEIGLLMNTAQISPASEIKMPKIWKYALGYPLLVIFWVIILGLWIKPRFMAPGGSLAVQLLAYLIPPLVVLLTAYFLHRRSVRTQRLKRDQQLENQRLEAERQRQDEEARAAAILDQKRFTLEVLALGLSVEHFQQAEIWDEIRGQDHPDAIFPEDPLDEAGDGDVEEKERRFREREAETLGRALGWINEEWTIPTFVAGPMLQNPQMAGLLESNLAEALAHAGVKGRAMKVVESFQGKRPTAILQSIFDFMERHIEVPAVLLVTEDGPSLRNALRHEDSPEVVHDGPRRQEDVTESVVAFVFGRKERVEPMQKAVPGDSSGYGALTPFWEKQQVGRTSSGIFNPTSWMPKAWSKSLMSNVSGLVVLGQLHRPQPVSFLGSNGILGPGSQASAFAEGWQTLQESRTNEEPLTHLLYNHGAVEQGRRLAPLNRTLATFEPDWDVIDQGINLHRHLGNTGVNAPFLGLALGVIASFREGGLSVSVDLGQDDHADLLMITEPAERGEATDGPDPLDAAFDYAHV